MINQTGILVFKRGKSVVRVQHSGKVSLQDGFEVIRRMYGTRKLSAIGIGVSTTAIYSAALQKTKDLKTIKSV